MNVQQSGNPTKIRRSDLRAPLLGSKGTVQDLERLGFGVQGKSLGQKLP